MEAFPDPAGALGHVSVRRPAVMHLQVLVRAVAKELRAPRPEVGERGEELLGCGGCGLVHMDRRHAFSLREVQAVGRARQSALHKTSGTRSIVRRYRDEG